MPLTAHGSASRPGTNERRAPPPGAGRPGRAGPPRWGRGSSRPREADYSSSACLPWDFSTRSCSSRGTGA